MFLLNCIKIYATLYTKSTPPPTLADFRAPSNQFEHNFIVTRLMEGGSLRSEAGQAISSCKAAFNKALREYKKLNVNPQVNLKALELLHIHACSSTLKCVHTFKPFPSHSNIFFPFLLSSTCIQYTFVTTSLYF